MSSKPSPPLATGGCSLPALAVRNARRSRRENLIYFFTLTAAIASFYIICALPKQDVIVYLREFESDAVNRLFSLMPVEFGIALFLLFFLVLFANTYQLERRGREFGVYLMLGMRRRRLFGLLVLEGLIASALALAIGLTLGCVFGELISLVTARLLGQGIIAHQLSLSVPALIQTALGFLAIQTLALLVLTSRLMRRELATLLKGQMEKKQHKGAPGQNLLMLVVGVVLLVAAYFLAPREFSALGLGRAALTLLFCLVGTIATIKGVTRLLSLLAASSSARAARGLTAFNLRQLQETLVNRSTSVAVVCFLMTLALIGLGAGTDLICAHGQSADRSIAVYDFTVMADPHMEEGEGYVVGQDGVEHYDPTLYFERRAAEDLRIETTLTSPEYAPYVTDLNEMRIGMAQVERDPETGLVLPASLNASNLRRALDEALAAAGTPTELPTDGGFSIEADFTPLQRLAVNLSARIEQSPYLVPLSSYNRLLAAAGEDPMMLESSQAALYLNPQFFDVEAPTLADEVIARAQQQGAPALTLGGEAIHLVATPPAGNLVCDRTVTIVLALIVPDTTFDALTDPLNTSTYWNFRIPSETAERLGLMQAIRDCGTQLDASGFVSENYLQNFGRSLFYTITGAYTLLYLGALFLLIAITVLALQFLTTARATLRRYLTLGRIGATRQQMHASVRMQVVWYNLLPLVLACISATVGLRTTMDAIISSFAAGSGSPLFVGALFLFVGVLIALYALATTRTIAHALDTLEYERVE